MKIKINEKSRRTIERLAPCIGLVLLIVVSALLGGNTFLATRNIRNILIQSSMLMVISVGTAFVMSHGNMDFANGGTMGIAMVVAVALCKGIPGWAILPVSVLTGLVVGVLVGVLVTRLKVVAFIVGMCIMRLSSAILYTTTNSKTWFAPAELSNLSKPWFYVVCCVVVVAVGVIVFERTKIGQYNKAIGVNANAAKLSGINVSKYLIFAFAASGICSGIAAFMMTVRTGGLVNSTGSFEVDALIGLTIGGMPLSGGSKASIQAAVIGSLVLTILNNILLIVGVNVDFVNVIKGAVFLALVLISYQKHTGAVTE